MTRVCYTLDIFLSDITRSGSKGIISAFQHPCISANITTLPAMFSHKIFNKIIENCLQAASAGSHVLLAALNTSDEALNIKSKEDGSVVSNADYASEKIISDILKPLGIPIISEESEIPPFEERKKWKHYFLIDPLDGTESFVSNRTGFSINIALCDDSGPIIGVVADPLANTIYIGALGKGVSSAQLDGSNLTSIQSKEIQRPYRMVTSWLEKADVEELLPPGIDSSEIVVSPVGGALKFCRIALGEAEIHARTGPYMEWDCAAGDAILRSIGVDVLGLKTHKRLTYNSENLIVKGLYTTRV
jgi:3'(2'), 5'-bisphosphate nucleotidase